MKPSLTINWAARSRAVTGPASALSVSIELQTPSLSGTAATTSADRAVAPAAYTGTYSFPKAVPAGAYVLEATFYSQTGATGNVVATAVAGVLATSSGQLTTTTGSALDINAASNLAAVSVVPNQSIPIGTATTLLVSGTDMQGNIFALTPGSVFMHLAAGGAYATLQSNGDLLGVASGLVTVYAVVDGITSPQTTVSVLPPSVAFRTLALTSNAIIQNPISGVLYASVPSTGGTYGNQVVEINPSTGLVTRSVFAGSEPTAMGITSDGTTLYVGLNGSESICVVNTAAMTVGQTFPLSQTAGQVAYDIKVQPGNNGVIAVTTEDVDDSGSFGPTIFNNGVPLPNALSFYQGQELAWPTASVLYAYNNVDTGFDLDQVTVNAQGATLTRDLQGRFSGFNTVIKLFGTRIYGSDGGIVDTATGDLVGRFAASGFDVVADLVQNRAAIAWSDAAGNVDMNVFTTGTFLPVGSFEVPGVFPTGSPYTAIASGLCRYGAHGLAFRAPTALYFIDNAPGF